MIFSTLQRNLYRALCPRVCLPVQNICSTHSALQLFIRYCCFFFVFAYIFSTFVFIYLPLAYTCMLQSEHFFLDNLVPLFDEILTANWIQLEELAGVCKCSFCNAARFQISKRAFIEPYIL